MKPGITASIKDTLDDLRRRGYKHKFRREATLLWCPELKIWCTTEQFTVEDCYYCEQPSGPDGDRVLYAITTYLGIKGVLVEMYGVYVDNISERMIRKLEVSTGLQTGFFATINYTNPVESW